jgi:hypothetical protein
MKKLNVLAVALFIAAVAAGGMLSIGGGVQAQVTTTASGPVVCTFGLPSVPAGQQATLTATGGNGSYVWSSPGLTINNPTGSTFGVAFNDPGTYPVTVTSNGQSATCSVLVTAPLGTTPTTPTTPGLPDTGEMPL